MNTQTINGYCGFYQFEGVRLDPDGNEVSGSREVILPWFPNLITDTGLDLLGADVDNLVYCRLGTGNTTPAFTDTQLGAQVGYTSTSGAAEVTGVSVDGTYLYRRITRRFAAGSVSGVNLAEVGMSYTTSGATLFSRALLSDPGGSPTTITLDPVEVLDVVYELRLYFPAQDQTTTAVIDGVTTTITFRYMEDSSWHAEGAKQIGRNMVQNITTNRGVAAYSALLPTSQGNLTYDGSPVPVTTTYQGTGSFTTNVKFSFGLAQGNVSGGIGAVVYERYYPPNGMSGPLCWQIGFSPSLNKDSSRTAEVTYSITWGRYTP